MDFHTYQNKLMGLKRSHFESLALEAFHYQARANPVYARWLELIHAKPEQVDSLQAIPFLPIRFFKTQQVVSGWAPEEKALHFESSRTTGQTPSRHFLRSSRTIYAKRPLRCFQIK